jgi:ABC-2 type transport system ATP-binding protein
MPEPVIQVENLIKRYGELEAVRGVSFSVDEGEVFGLLGPNGAGKTTTVEILEGLRNLDGGRVSVCGLDPQRDSVKLKNEIGAALQSTSLPDKLKTFEAIKLFAGFGGQKQRLALAMALVNNPRVLFFDEPTAGLDPQVRREIYDIIDELRQEKKTIVMTTHYIEEAERLCDRVAIVDHGKVIALGTPQELKNRSGDKTRIEVQLTRPEPPETLRALEGVSECRDLNGGYALHTQRPPQAIVSLVKYLEAQGNELVSLNIATPSLEDVFIELTGRRLRD